jgi:hypothetical protein
VRTHSPLPAGERELAVIMSRKIASLTLAVLGMVGVSLAGKQTN